MTQAQLITLLEQLIKDRTSVKNNRSNVATEVAREFIKQAKPAVSAAIIAELDENYTKENLVALAKHARKMVSANEVWLGSLQLNLPYTWLNTLDTNAPKAKLLWAVAVIFSLPSVMQKFHETLPRELQKAFEKLTWLTEAKIDVLGKLIGENMLTPGNSSRYYQSTPEMEAIYKVLPHKSTGWGGSITLSWPKNIREFLRNTYPQPSDYHIKTIEEPPAHLARWEEGEVVIFEEIQKLLAYRLQDAIVINASGKVAANAFKKMRKTLGIREFLPDNEPFSLLRTLCLAQVLAAYAPAKNQINVDSLEILKQLQKTLLKELKLLHLLNDLKNHGFVNMYGYKQEAEKTLIEIMERLPSNKWVSIENLVAYAQIHDLQMLPTHDYSSLAYEVPSSNSSYSEKMHVNSNNLYSFVQHPALLGGLFLMAALGWLDIAYEAPTGQFGTNYYSSFDGLRCVRLNDLGAHIFGHSGKTYTPKVNKATQELIFDDKSLLIFCDPENAVAETVLANYAERVSNTRFLVTPQTFLKDCKSKAQLSAKISLFQKSVAPNLADNWHRFFDDILSKAEPFIPTNDLVVLRIPPANQTLIKLLAQDEVLKSIVLKAEGFRILVPQNQISKLKSRLRELGYLMA